MPDNAVFEIAGLQMKRAKDILQRLSQTRNDSDYNIIVEITEQDAFTRFEQAKKLVSEIDRYMQAQQ